MGLSFTPPRAFYDPNRRVVRFFAHDGSLLVRCCVTRNALVAVATAHGLERIEPLFVYRALRRRIQAVAKRKHQLRRREVDGSIMIRRSDLSAV